jgi:hypothetical protein
VRVYRGDVVVLEVEDVSGALLSRMAPPPLPGEPPTPHPFLSGTAFVASEERGLADILERSQNFDDFLGLLRADGLRVVEGPVDL